MCCCFSPDIAMHGAVAAIAVACGMVGVFVALLWHSVIPVAAAAAIAAPSGVIGIVVVVVIAIAVISSCVAVVGVGVSSAMGDTPPVCGLSSSSSSSSIFLFFFGVDALSARTSSFSCAVVVVVGCSLLSVFAMNSHQHAAITTSATASA